MTVPLWVPYGLCCRWILVIVVVSGPAVFLSICSCMDVRYVVHLPVVSAWVCLP